MTHVETAQHLLREGKRLEAARFLNHALGFGTPEERIIAKQILSTEFSAFDESNYENEQHYLEALRHRVERARDLCRLRSPRESRTSQCNPPSEHEKSNGNRAFNDYSHDMLLRPNSSINHNLLTCVLLLMLAKNYLTENLPDTSDQNHEFNF